MSGWVPCRHPPLNPTSLTDGNNANDARDVVVTPLSFRGWPSRLMGLSDLPSRLMGLSDQPSQPMRLSNQPNQLMTPSNQPNQLMAFLEHPSRPTMLLKT
jgi:hypothetical protein